jgi:hypothetical protein
MDGKKQALRQGEILIIETESFESDINSPYKFNQLKVVENGVIREGEKSGHKHQVKDAILYSDSEGNLYIKAESAQALIEHPEHKTLKLGKKVPGTVYYKVVIQREYDEAKHSRNVVD